MLLSSFVILSTFGAGLWLLGHYFGFHGVAAIGAVLMIAVGGAAAATSVAVKDGTVTERSYEDFNESDGSVDPIETNATVSQTTREVAVTDELGAIQSYMLGALVLIAGALLLVQDLNEVG